jgi:type III secretory pathway lipoprotein EscJ
MKHGLRLFLSKRRLFPSHGKVAEKEIAGRGLLSLLQALNLNTRFKGCFTTKVVVGALILFHLSACEKVKVAEELDQRGAHEVVAALGRRGISATLEKQRGAKGQYSVLVDSAAFGDSVQLLTNLGLPSERKTSFSELVTAGGILPSSKQSEALKLDRALAAEIEELLRGHPGIADASVVVRFHALTTGQVASVPQPISTPGREVERGEASETLPAVSMIIQRRDPAAVQLEEIRQLVGRVVPGVRPAEIVISLTEKPVFSGIGVDESEKGGAGDLVPFLLFSRVPRDSYNILVIGVIVVLGIIGALTGFLGYIFGQYVLTRQLENEDQIRLDGGRRYPELGSGEDDEGEEDL